MNVGIVTDSTCDLDQEVIDRYGIKVLPIIVDFGTQTYRDGINLTADEFFEKLTPGEDFPTTSQPAPGVFIDYYQQLADEFDQVISLHLSAGLSGTAETARLAADQVADLEVEVIDSASISLGLGFQVLLAARMSAAGSSLAEITAVVKQAQEKLTLYFTVNDLSYMEAGGRIGKAKALLGSIFKINPIIEISPQTGKVNVVDKKRGADRARERLLELTRKNLKGEEKAWIGLAHGDRPEAMATIKKQLIEVLADKELAYSIFRHRISSTLGCHVGPSVYAVITLAGDFLPERKEK